MNPLGRALCTALAVVLLVVAVAWGTRVRSMAHPTPRIVALVAAAGMVALLPALWDAVGQLP